MIDFEERIYEDRRGRFEAVFVSDSEIKELLGIEHDGSNEHDAELVEALLGSGAPDWVLDADIWEPEGGRGFIGPPIE